METNTTLPSRIIDSSLSIEEIGAIFVVFSLPNVSEDVKTRWSNNEDLMKIFKELENKHMLKREGDKILIDIDDPSKQTFFYVEDYDDDDNPIYAAPSPIGDEDDGAYLWRIRPRLEDMKVVWENCSDKELINKHVEVRFDSFEDAEKYFKVLHDEIINGL
jgi:hypothetical protein